MSSCATHGTPRSRQVTTRRTRVRRRSGPTSWRIEASPYSRRETLGYTGYPRWPRRALDASLFYAVPIIQSRAFIPALQAFNDPNFSCCPTQDTKVTLPPGADEAEGCYFYLAGVNDFESDPDYGAALSGRDASIATVLLAHQPIQARERNVFALGVFSSFFVYLQ